MIVKLLIWIWRWQFSAICWTVLTSFQSHVKMITILVSLKHKCTIPKDYIVIYIHTFFSFRKVWPLQTHQLIQKQHTGNMFYQKLLLWGEITVLHRRTDNLNSASQHTICALNCFFFRQLLKIIKQRRPCLPNLLTTKEMQQRNQIKSV